MSSTISPKTTLRRINYIVHIVMTSFITAFMDNKSIQIKVSSPSMTLKLVLDKFCEKFNMEANEFGLKYKRNFLDLSLSVRYANLPPGAKLEVFKIIDSNEEIVLVALQTETANSRQVEKFLSSTSLWKILKSFEKTPEVKITTRSSGKFYLMPSCIILNKEYSTIDILKTTTLKDIGIRSGNVIIKIRFIEQSLELMPSENNDYHDYSIKEIKNIIGKDDLLTGMNVSREETVIASEISSEQIEKEKNIDRETKVFRPSNEMSQIELPDSFFSLSANELKAVLSESKQKQEEKPLMTKNMRDKLELEKKLKYPKVFKLKNNK
jgi:hypothetical protein